MVVVLLFLILLQITQAATTNCDYHLSNSNFIHGTYRIKKQGKYCLTEDIIFNPNKRSIKDPNSEHAWFPDPNDANFFNKNDSSSLFGPFSLGFFAAITIETDNVELDLKQHSIIQHKHFYIQQRFYAHIVIGDSPFVSGYFFIFFIIISVFNPTSELFLLPNIELFLFLLIFLTFFVKRNKHYS